MIAKDAAKLGQKNLSESEQVSLDYLTNISVSLASGHPLDPGQQLLVALAGVLWWMENGPVSYSLAEDLSRDDKT